MADLQSLVDEMRSYLRSADQTYDDGLKELAASFAGVCRDANQGLRRCEEFLQKGLRSEALHFAQTHDPPLLDVIGVLDFPEREDWDLLAASYGLPQAPKLRLDCAEELNRAYAADQPIESLLRKHRYLALIHAPLVSRLEVMRRVSELDPGNSVWLDDVTQFEKVRLKEVRREIEQAVSKADEQALSAIMDELSGSPWQNGTPFELVNLVRKYHLETLASSVQRAYAKRSVKTLERLRESWIERTAQMGPGLDGGFEHLVEPAFRWLDQQYAMQNEQSQYLEAVAALEESLQADDDWQTVQRRYRSAAAYGQALPAHVLRAYRERNRDERETVASGRRDMLIILGVGSAAILGAAIFLLWLLVLKKG